MNRGVIILGMHRSGTSCLAGMLQSAGFYAGKVDEWTPDNNKGSRENRAVVELNNSILSHGGGSWSKPDVSLSPASEHIQNRNNIIQQFLESGSPWMFKDPRTLLTLSFWLETLESTTFLGIFRHPFAVANSLLVRNSMPLREGLLLWQSYNERLLKVVESKQPTLLYFGENVDSFIEATNIFLAKEFPVEIDNGTLKPEKMREFISSDLIHQIQSSEEDLEYKLTQAGLSGKQAAALTKVWEGLMEHAENPPVLDHVEASIASSQSDPVSDFVEKNQFEKALHALEAELATNRKRTDLWQQGISIIKKIGDTGMLSTWIERSLDANPGHPGLLFEQAKISWQSGHQKDGLKMMEKVVSLTPGWEPAIKLLSSWYYEKHQWQKAADLLLNLHISNRSNVESLNFAQLFVDAGAGFNEEDSIRQPVITKGQISDLVFDLSRFEKVKALRFDPLNDFTVIRMEEIIDVDNKGKESRIVLEPNNSNAQFSTTNLFGFSTRDPQIRLKVPPSKDHLRSELRVSLEYVHVGSDALLQCLEQQSKQHELVNSPADIEPDNQIAASPNPIPAKAEGVLRAWELDKSDEEDLDGTEIVIQGWAVPIKSDKLNIVFQYGGLTRSYDCNVNRPDVVAQFTDESRLRTINSICGFQYKVPRGSKIDVGVEADMRIYWIETIRT